MKFKSDAQRKAVFFNLNDNLFYKLHKFSRKDRMHYGYYPSVPMVGDSISVIGDSIPMTGDFPVSKTLDEIRLEKMLRNAKFGLFDDIELGKYRGVLPKSGDVDGSNELNIIYKEEIRRRDIARAHDNREFYDDGDRSNYEMFRNRIIGRKNISRKEENELIDEYMSDEI
jgi:hypothetical protein